MGNVIRIFDTTLRDGEQMPGVALKPEDKLEIARKLDELGVNVIEAGFPATSPGEKKAVTMIAREGFTAEVCALSRALKHDIDVVINCDVNYIHLFIATSDLHLKYKLKKSREEVIAQAVSSVEYAKEHGLKVEFSAEDATRTDINFLREFYKQVTSAGADLVNIPDTVGVAHPDLIKRIVKEVKKTVNVPVSVHCHNDLGLATANSIAAVEAGARQVHVTVNGVGERAGNAALEEVTVCLKRFYGVKLTVKTELLYKVSRFVAQKMRVYVPPNKPVVGENAFSHEAGIHVHGVLSNPLTYEPLRPEEVGHKRRIVIGKHTGLHAVKAVLRELGLPASEEIARAVCLKVKELGDKGVKVTRSDILRIIEDLKLKGDFKALTKPCKSKGRFTLLVNGQTAGIKLFDPKGNLIRHIEAPRGSFSDLMLAFIEEVTKVRVKRLTLEFSVEEGFPSTYIALELLRNGKVELITFKGDDPLETLLTHVLSGFKGGYPA